ncbi:cation:proton antiporter [Actinacidiphila guanduensis]|jgi:multicomponent Na+:H+ antiporter subunit G|uniref:Multisubunit sodium/proton antiporter, MrpG subunit n=1 Tax=Actinacidiphila guanduensis TaxID=310781 RepID=A0A1G9VXH1_9ACTN|nr:monovalent cation/H(+) antiporter subunit G [Actinacidiphila guanduensis]SDM76627.1 multisubunit sodium/proton antiporter, MrpG subunit [Actinacidiphila guanduensis]
MDARHVCALALLTAGCAALLLAAAALLLLPTPYARLHALSPASSLGVPLICLALALDAGAGRQAVKLLFVGALTALSGPALTVVIGRTMLRAEEAGGDAADVPEEPPA